MTGNTMFSEGYSLMPSDPSRPLMCEAPGSVPKPVALAPMHRRRRSLRQAAIVLGLIAALLAAFAWSELHPEDLAKAEAAYRRNDLPTALRLAESHLARRPSSLRTALVAARCLSRLGRPDQAEAHYQKAAPLDLDDRHIRALAFVVSNRREPAIGAYREILESRPDDVLAWSRMAAVLISENRWGEVLEASERLIRIPEGEVIGHTLAGVVYHNTRDPELAVFAFDRVLALDPDLERMPLKPRSMFWTQYGHNLLVVGRWVEARRCLYRALEEGDDPMVDDLLGQSYYLEGAFDDAEQCWRRTIQQAPDRYGTWWRLGKLALLRGRPADAIEPLRRASALQPRAIGPYYSLSLAYRRLGRNDESDRSMQQVRDLRGGTAAPPSDDGDASPLGAEAMARE